MTKIELQKEIEVYLRRIEDPVEDKKNKVEYLENGIRLTREYLERYKRPYNYSFMGTRINFSGPVIDELEIIKDSMNDK